MKKIFSSLLILVLLIISNSISVVADIDINNNTIILSEVENVSIHTLNQKGMLSSPLSFYSYYGVGKAENSRPVPINLSWSTKLTGTFTVKLSEFEDFSVPFIYTTSNYNIDVYNLKIATKYFWKVSCGKSSSDVSSFETEGYYPRNLNVDKVSNVRDIGGFVTSDGSIIKQGLLYRGGRFNKVNASEITISEKGAKTLVNDFGIKTEIDLRVKSELGGWTSSILNTFEKLDHKVAYYNFPLDPSDKAPYYYLLRDNNLESTKKIFEILADENNYPIYFHCSLGTDRAGELADILHYLCSVPTEDVDYDYSFSNLAAIGSYRDYNKASRTALQELILNYGDSVNRQSTASCLKDKLGLTDDTINNIVNILVDSNDKYFKPEKYQNLYLSVENNSNENSKFIFDSYVFNNSIDYSLQMKVKASENIIVNGALNIGNSKTELLETDIKKDISFSTDWQTIDMNISSFGDNSKKFISFNLPKNSKDIQFYFDDIVLINNNAKTVVKVFNTYQHYENNYEFISGIDFISNNFTSVANVISENNFDIKLDLLMFKGAQIRIDKNNGLRYMTKVNTKQLSKLIENNFKVEFGTLIAPENYLQKPEDLTFDLPSSKYLVVPYNVDLINGSFKGSLIKIMESSLYSPISGNLNRGFVGRGYAKISKDGITTTVYAKLDDNIRSVSQIAFAYKNDINSDYNGLSDTLKQFVDKWANYYIK